MLRPRIVPCLLVRGGGLVKTQRFQAGKYVGDPLNAVRIFNEKEVDELTVLDIDATAKGAEPNYEMIRSLAVECRMPLCYGGGVRSVEQVRRIIGLGAEKVALSAAALARPALVTEAADAVGRQSVVVVIDARRKPRGGWEVLSHNGTRPVEGDPVSLAARMQAAGAGEIVVNSIDRDGEMKGYDLELARAVRAATTVPMTVLGGAGSLADIESLLHEFRIIGAAAGSLFVFKGVYRAVLINYPTRAEKDALLERAS